MRDTLAIRLLIISIFLLAAFRHVKSRSVAFKSPLSEDYYDEDVLPIDDVEENLLADFASKVPACQAECSRHFTETLRVAVHSENHYERFNRVCENFNNTIRCMDEAAKNCLTQEPFDIATSGLYFMCIDQRNAFNAVIECVDAQADSVQIECDEQCRTKGKLASWSIQSGVFDALLAKFSGRELSNIPMKSNPEFLRNIAQDGCELIRCQLGCIRTKYNTRCLNNAGTLLSEALVRPLAETQKAMGFGPVSYVLHSMLPRQCDFILYSEVLDEYRIDPTLDQSLKMKFDNESVDKRFQEDVNLLTQQAHNVDPEELAFELENSEKLSDSDPEKEKTIQIRNDGPNFDYESRPISVGKTHSEQVKKSPEDLSFPAVEFPNFDQKFSRNFDSSNTSPHSDSNSRISRESLTEVFFYEDANNPEFDELAFR